MTATWERALDARDVPDGEVRVAIVGGHRLAICNLEGEFFAVQDLCTHDNGPLGEGCLEGDEIECPRHGARFSIRTGAATLMPAVMPVPTFPVRREGDDVLVQVP